MKISKLRLFFTVFILLLLSGMPLGTSMLAFLRPLWILLFVIYLQCTLSRSINVGFILLLGLLLDALGGSALGEQTFALLLTAWIFSECAQRFRLFPMPQQLLGIALLSGGYQLILVLIAAFLGYSPVFSEIFLPVLTTVLCWPWLQYLCDGLFFSPVRKRNRHHVIKHHT